MPSAGENLYFFSNIYTVPNDRNQIPLKDLLFYEGGLNPLLNISFTGSNCSGDLVITQDNSPYTLVGDTFAYPSSCGNSANVNDIKCNTLSYKKITGTPTFQNIVSIQSSIQMQYSMYSGIITNPSTTSNYFVCVNSTYSSNGWVYSSSSIQTATPPSSPLILYRNQLSITR
jgi:hypothetical protein